MIWENLFKDQSVFHEVTTLYILTTFSLDYVLISLGENWFSSNENPAMGYKSRCCTSLKLNVHCRFMWHTSCILLRMECLLLNHQHSKPNKANCGTSKWCYVEGLQLYFKSRGYTCMFLESIQQPCLVPGPHYCALPMRFGLRGRSKSPTLSSQIHHRNALTEKA